jgi:DNA-binding IclR family transcriptional regulator
MAKAKSGASKRRKPGQAVEIEAGNSLERMIGILDLFEGNTFRWTVEQLHERLGYTRSTLYRYLKVLTDAELLTSLPDVGYTLGPRIIELDFNLRRQDPLILASRPVMSQLVQDVPGISLLCRRYRDKVLCVHQEQSTVAIHSTYERGRARPLLLGAASRIILANMPVPRIKRLFETQPREFAAAGLGRTLSDVREKLKKIRQAGWDETTGQVTPGIVGVAAPIFDSRENVLGSLSISLPQKGIDAVRIEQIADRVMFCARVVTQAVSDS